MSDFISEPQANDDLPGEVPAQPVPQGYQQPLPPIISSPAAMPPIAGAYPYVQRPPKDKSIALILEILPGLFGLLGFGWIYSGNTTTGVLLLVGFLAWMVVAIIINIASAGFGCFCTIPVNLIAVGLSAVMLNDYAKKHPEIFGR